MEFIVGDFILDTDRLIIYPAALSKEDKQLICTCVAANDNYDELCGRLNRLDADHMNAEKCLPPTAGICLTYRCQLNCNYCSFCSQESGTELELCDVTVFINFLLKRHLVRQIAAKQKSDFILYFTGGGEPTKNWKLFQSTVDYIREKCISNNIRYQLHLTTNGMLSESQVQYIYKTFSTIMVSYDGISEIQDHNRRISGGGKSSPVVERTIAVLDALDAAYTIRTTIWQSDFNKLCDMADHIYTSFPRHKGWSISPILVTGRAIENMEDAYLDGDKYNFIDYFVKAANYALNRYSARSMSIKLFSNSRTDIFCGSCYVLNPWLMPDGSISTCLEAKEGIPVIGSVKGGRVVMYPEYTDELLKEYRRRFLSDSCRHCIAFRFCRVGCPLKFVQDNYSGRDAAAWVCDMTKYYWRYIIQQITEGNRVFGWYAKRLLDARLQHILVYEMKDSAEGFLANTLQCTILHGSLVRMCEKNILMIGARRSGKTTMTRLFLEKYDSEYIDDDCVYIVDGVYRGFHMPVFMRDGEGSRAELTTVDEEGIVRRVYIPRKRVEAVEKVDIILFPHFQEGTEPDVCRIEGTNLFRAIINNTRHHCDRRLLMHDITRLSNQAKAYRVTYGSSDQAVRFIEKYIIGSLA